MNKIFRSQRGVLFLDVIFLTLVTSFAAMILLNAAPRVRNRESTLRLTAIHLANEQLAHLEAKAASGTDIIGSHNFLGDAADLKTFNGGGEEIIFNVTTDVDPEDLNNLDTVCTATVTVTWKVGEKISELAAEREIRFVKTP